MSAFVVNDETINKIVSFLHAKAQSSYRSYWPCRLIEDVYHLREKNEADRLAVDMFRLNVQAVNERYGDGQADEFRELDFNYHFMMPPPVMHVYKALEYWRYQCSEGDVPQSELYKLMNRVFNAIAHRMVQDQPQYNTAPWS